MSLADQLDTLEISGLVLQAMPPPELEYIFRHALTQEAAYNSILKSQRRALHLAVGETLERNYPGRREELAALLAAHFAAAEDHPRARAYYTLAGDYAARRQAIPESLAHYSAALALTDISAAASEDLRHLYSALGRTLELSGKYEEALAHYLAMQELAQQRGDRAMELAALTARAVIHSNLSVSHDPAQSELLAEQALALARELGDQAAEAKVLWARALALSLTGHPRESLEPGERALKIARSLGLREQLAYVLNDLSLSYSALGQSDRVSEVLEESRRLWVELGNLPMLADNLGRSAVFAMYAGDLPRAFEAAREGLRVSESLGHAWGRAENGNNLGFLYFLHGEFGEAIEIIRESIPFAEQAGHGGILVFSPTYLALIASDLGQCEEGLRWIERGAAEAHSRVPAWLPWTQAVEALLRVQTGEPDPAAALVQLALSGLNRDDFFVYPLALLAITNVAWLRGDFDRTLAHTASGLEYLQAAHERISRLDFLILRGRALHALGRSEEARRFLTEAVSEAEAIGARRSLWPALLALRELELQQGDAVEAEALRARAVETINYIADHVGNNDRRASFLTLPEVRAALIDPQR